MTGSGAAKGRPNQVEINAAVITTGKSAKATVDAISRTMTQVLAHLSKVGIKDDSIVTMHFDVSPRFQKLNGRNDAPVISGYQVNSRLTVTATEIENVGNVLDQLTTAGINQISGLRFLLTAQESRTKQILSAAMAHARFKTEIVAEAAHANLGLVLKVEERGTSVPQPRLMAFSERNTVPIVPGEQTVRASVSVTSALVDITAGNVPN